MADQQRILYLVIFLIWIDGISGFEPITIGVGVALGSAIYAGWSRLPCKFIECCDDNWIPLNFTKLEHSLKTHLYGQHIAQDVVLKAFRAHFRQDSSPKKALALSFHGWSGSGKTFVSQFIMDSMFKEGSKSKFAHFFAGRSHFSMDSKTDIYKIDLIDWIRGNVTNCGRSLFVFDEVDKIPKGVLDGIKAFFDYHDNINGIDYRKATFIFLSNTGSSLIVDRLLKLWESGVKREDIKLNDFEDLIRKGAFNEKGGFHRAEAIESNLIDHYIPFLPMGEMHVRQCIKAEFKRMGVNSPHEEHIKEVLKDLTFGPEPHNLFSNSGCKRISPKVGTVIEKVLFDM